MNQLKNKYENQTCYMCGRQAVNREHVPPRGFFPLTHRNNLITVPSCEKHNNDNSEDVEYVRNIIAHEFGTNKLARSHVADKVLRSYQYSQKLFDSIFGDSKPINFNGQNTQIIFANLNRLELIIRGVAYAVYFRNFGKTFKGGWDIISPNLLSRDSKYEIQSSPYFEAFQLLKKLKFDMVKTPYPEIFQCEIHWQSDFKFFYKFTFYEGFVIYAISELKL